MDQTEVQFPKTDNHYMTREFLEKSLADNSATIKQLQEHIQKITQRDYSTAATLQNLRDNMHTWTMNALEENSITETSAEEIAEICGFELSKEVEVEVSVTYTMTVNVGPNEDVEDIVNNIDFDTVSYNEDNISWMSSSIDRIDF
jgi:hypothetical protein